MDSLVNHCLLFLSKGEAISTAAFDRFGIGSGPFTGVKRRENDTAVFPIKESYSVALVATHFLERIEAHDRRLVKAPGTELVQAIRDRKQLLNVLVERPYGFLGFKEGLFKALTVFS